jgi:hypothetical protein
MIEEHENITIRFREWSYGGYSKHKMLKPSVEEHRDLDMNFSLRVNNTVSLSAVLKAL